MKRSIKSALTAMAQAALAFGIALGINYILQACSSPSTKVLHVLTTGDVHASWFGTPYQGSSTRLSLENVSWYADSVRTSDGASNVLLLAAEANLPAHGGSQAKCDDYMNQVKQLILRHLLLLLLLGLLD